MQLHHLWVHPVQDRSAASVASIAVVAVTLTSATAGPNGVSATALRRTCISRRASPHSFGLRLKQLHCLGVRVVLQKPRIIALVAITLAVATMGPNGVSAIALRRACIPCWAIPRGFGLRRKQLHCLGVCVVL